MILPDVEINLGTPKGRIVATYDYVSADGEVLYQVVRFAPKDFRQRRPVGSGWSWSVKGVPRVLYRLPEVRAAIAAGRTVYVCEGEKDADAAAALGLAATCNSGGADNGSGSKWLQEFGDALSGADVIVIPDRDAAGEKHAARVVSTLGKARRVRVAEPTTGKDLSDWIAAGATAADIEAAAVEVAREKPEPRPRIALESFASIDPSPPAGQWLIRDLLPTEGLAVVYGPPKNYKSFVVLDLALSVAAGRDWAGKRVKQGPVVYIAAEGAAGLRNRIRAYKQRGDLPADLPFHLIAARPNLGTETGDGAEFVAAIRAALGDAAPVAVIIDTLARSLGGGEENGAGMMAFADNAEDMAAEFGALALAIHHEGKNGDNGMRGHSSLPGAMVAGWRVKKTSALRCSITVEAAKDGEDGFGIDARLAVVDLGAAPDTDEPVKTLIVEAVEIARREEDPAEKTGRRADITPSHRALMRAFSVALERHGIDIRPMGPSSSFVRAVERDAVRAAYFEIRGDEIDAESLRKDFSRVLGAAIKREALFVRQRGEEAHLWVV